LPSFYTSIALTGQYAAHMPQFVQLSFMLALTLTIMASNLQNVAHWPHPTQLSFIFIEPHRTFLNKMTNNKSIIVRIQFLHMGLLFLADGFAGCLFLPEILSVILCHNMFLT